MNVRRLAPALITLSLVAIPWLNARAAEPSGSVPASPASAGSLFVTVAALDAEVFDAFNRCAAADQLERHAAYFSAAVEFYHDNGGVTWDRAQMLANTKQHACGQFRRELVPGTLRVFPVKDFGAIAQGVHRFCQSGSTKCDGAADFLMVWRQEGSTWSITRVFSYGHRPND